MDQTAEDKLTGYNRPEHLRAHPETDPVFDNVTARTDRLTPNPPLPTGK